MLTISVVDDILPVYSRPRMVEVLVGVVGRKGAKLMKRETISDSG